MQKYQHLANIRVLFVQTLSQHKKEMCKRWLFCTLWVENKGEQHTYIYKYRGRKGLIIRFIEIFAKKVWKLRKRLYFCTQKLKRKSQWRDQQLTT